MHCCEYDKYEIIRCCVFPWQLLLPHSCIINTGRALPLNFIRSFIGYQRGTKLDRNEVGLLCEKPFFSLLLENTTRIDNLLIV